jgi:hypothetical protein
MYANRAFPAQIASACAECGQPIRERDPIRHVPGTGYVHDHCPDDPDTLADQAALAQPRCSRCGANHPGEC